AAANESARASAADRPAAVPAQSTVRLHDKHRATLRAARRGAHHRPACTRDQHLALAAAIPVDGDSLATKLVRELVRSFDVSRGRLAPQVDRLADRGVHVALEGRLHLDVPGDVDVVRGREATLHLGRDGGMTTYPAVLGDGSEQLGRGEATGGRRTL